MRPDVSQQADRSEAVMVVDDLLLWPDNEAAV